MKIGITQGYFAKLKIRYQNKHRKQTRIKFNSKLENNKFFGGGRGILAYIK